MSGLLLCLLFSNYLWLLNSANSQLKTSSNKHTALWKTALTAVICTCIQLLVLLSVILLPFRLWCSSWYSMDSVFWGYFPVKLQPVYVVLWCGTQSRKGYLQGLLTRTISWVFLDFYSRSWGNLFPKVEIFEHVITWNLKLRCWAGFYDSCA